MTIGKNGIKNLAFIHDESKGEYGTFKFKDCEDIISVKNNKLDLNNEQDKIVLYIGKKLTKKGHMLILSLAATIFSACTSWSLIAPFFPRVAEAKGLTIAEYSLIFALYEVNKVFLPPFCSKVAMQMTPKYLLITSMFIIGWCSTLFGFLEYANPGKEFFWLCIVVRTAWSVGGAGGITCANLIGTLLLPNHIPTVYAAIEIGAGLGFIVGPFIGGYLFEMFGFKAPFLACSLLSFVFIIPIALIVENELKPKKDDQNEKPTTVFQAIKQPGVSVNLFMSAVCCFSIGFNDSSLDHHLREIGDFSPSQVGQIFLIVGVIYSFCTWFYSRIAENWRHSYYLIFLGCFLLFCSFIFVGPIHGLPLQPSLFYVIISQCCFGVGMGLLFVLSYDDCIKQAKMYLPKNDSTIAIVSGLYTSSYALGNAVGPFVGGQLIDKWGYRKTTVPMALTMVVATIVVAIYIFKFRKQIPIVSSEEES